MMFGYPTLRATPEVLARARGPLGDLEAHGLSRHRPYAVLHAETPAGARNLHDLIAAHRYWRALGLPIDLLVLDNAADPRETPIGAPDAPGVLRGSLAELSRAAVDRIDAAASFVVTDFLPDPRGPAARTSV